MTTHESNTRVHAVEPGSDRAFGVVVGGILLVVALYQWWSEISVYVWFGGVGGVLLVLGLMAPSTLRPLNLAWTKLGLLLGRIVTPVVMLLVYVVSIVPIGLGLRLFGKDVLGLKRGRAGESYWKLRAPPGPPPESLKDQF